MTAAFPPPPPASPPPPPSFPPGPPSSNGPGWVLVLLGGLLVTGALLAGLVLLWPSGDDGGNDATQSTATTNLTPLTTTTRDPNAQGEPSQSDGTVTPAPPVTPATTPVNLFDSGAQAVYADLVNTAHATEVLEVLIYPEYAFLAYRDAAHPANIDERQWRAGKVGAATPNNGDDRYDADTAAQLFNRSGINLTKLPALIDDAPRRFSTPVEVTHVIIDRFLPFDKRVLIRVYASPADGRSGGGYVQYTVDGAFVKTIQ